jgi:Flp pilus assembly protein TadG
MKGMSSPREIAATAVRPVRPVRTARRPAPARRGQALVEFALVALAFYLLFAGTVELGRMLFASQILQSAARVGARELAVTPLPATATFDEALAAAEVRARVYDPAALVVDVTDRSDEEVRAALDALPLLNRALSPLFQRDRTSVQGRELLRYPGALFRAADGSLRVLIPRVVERTSQGHETIEWLDVVEEAVPDADDPGRSPFSLVSLGPQRGLVALRIHYPFQAAALAAFKVEPAAGEPRNVPLLADDAAVTAPPAPHGAPLDGPATGPYAGEFALGSLECLGERVRPFRRLLTHQSFFRREVFSE